MSFKAASNGGWDNPVGHRDFTQGAVGIEDFDDTIKHVKKAAPKKPVKKKGCPGNDFNAHVYVWAKEARDAPWLGEDTFFKFYGFYKYEYKICAGCGRRDKCRLSEEYTKRFKREGKYAYEEKKDPEFQAYERERWRQRYL